MRHKWVEAWIFVRARALELRTKPFSELAALPEGTPLAAPAGLSKFQFLVWRQFRANGSLRVRVEAFRNYLLGIYSRSVWDGFDMTEDGSISEIPKDNYD